jgi:hypothetical protein
MWNAKYLACDRACPAARVSAGSVLRHSEAGQICPLRQADSGEEGNSCAAYGPGFVKVEGTDTCVQVGGAVSIGAGTSFGR